MSHPETINCPRCPDEVLIRALGNLLVCGACDRVFIESHNVNNFAGQKVEVLDVRNEYGRGQSSPDEQDQIWV